MRGFELPPGTGEACVHSGVEPRQLGFGRRRGEHRGHDGVELRREIHGPFRIWCGPFSGLMRLVKDGEPFVTVHERGAGTVVPPRARRSEHLDACALPFQVRVREQPLEDEFELLQLQAPLPGRHPRAAFSRNRCCFQAAVGIILPRSAAFDGVSHAPANRHTDATARLGGRHGDDEAAPGTRVPRRLTARARSRTIGNSVPNHPSPLEREYVTYRTRPPSSSSSA